MSPSLGDVQRRSMAFPTPTSRFWPARDALDDAEITRLLEMRRYGVLSTSRPDGRPHAVPVSFVLQGDTLWLASSVGTVHERNLAERPLAVLVVMGPRDEEDHVALVVEGTVLRSEKESARAALADVWEERYGDRLEWADVIFELAPTKVLSHGHGKLSS